MAKSKDGFAYSYNPTTFEYIEIVMAQDSPLEPGVLLLPANATFKKPPAKNKNKTVIYDKVIDKWEIVDDYRGKYFNANREEVEFTEIGKPLPPGLSKNKPPFTKKELDAQNNLMVISNIDEIEKHGIRAMRELMLKLSTLHFRTDDESYLAIKAIDDSIASERGKLK